MMKSQSETKTALSDETLVERAQRGDKKALSFLLAKYQRRVHLLVARYIADPQEQLDVIQDVFIKAFRGLDNFRAESKFFTWVYRIAINTAKNYLIAKDRRPPDQDIDIELSGLEELASPEHLALCDEIEQTVFEAIYALPDDMQEAIMMREIEGMSYEDIAQQMGCPVGTVRSRIFRARQMIDQCMESLLQS